MYSAHTYLYNTKSHTPLLEEWHHPNLRLYITRVR